MRKSLSFIVLIVGFTTCMVWAEISKDKVTRNELREAAVSFLEGHKALSAGNYDEAIKCYTKAKDLDPSFTNAYFFLGNIYLKKGMFDNAIYEYKKALALRPKAAATHAKLAYLKKGLLDEAMHECRKAIIIEPNNALAHFTLGYVYYKKGNKTAADDHLYKAGILYLKRDDVEGALEAYECLKLTNSKELEQKLYEKLNPGLKQKKVEPAK